jgi:tRNA(Ile)-lysidine synthase
VDLLEHVGATGLLSGPVVVLLSGGRDSTCLLDVAARLTDTTALHVNYGLREDAGADEAHCERLCARLEVPLSVERPPRRRRGNLQAWARDVRYAAAARAGRVVAAGHTADDQAETVLYRLASSPSRRALLGMAPREGRLVRPLLGVTRAQTAAHCAARGLEWREDPTNADPAFARTRIRADLLPALREVHPAAVDNVVRAAALLREEAEVLDALVDEALGGRREIELERLRALPPALQRLVVRRLAEDALGRLAPRVARRAPEILDLPDPGALDLGDGARVCLTGGIVRMQTR